ncbi:hypothetical protein DV515_00007700 [Chloebia gouldiae]|uniref:Uncharacterized protein n=1 Tax=Chloebia gouldiae TaxID=44316 RepID=A0A3L8SI80_CHLGU|nr:hypothetical protein DV515_00007700 [Chloebia gouldiae]
MLPSFSLLLLWPFSLCQISITESYFSLRPQITFPSGKYCYSNNSLFSFHECASTITVLSSSQHQVLPPSSVQGTWLKAKPLGEWNGLRAVFWGEARQNIQDKCLYANVNANASGSSSFPEDAYNKHGPGRFDFTKTISVASGSKLVQERTDFMKTKATRDLDNGEEGQALLPASPRPSSMELPGSVEHGAVPDFVRETRSGAGPQPAEQLACHRRAPQASGFP